MNLGVFLGQIFLTPILVFFLWILSVLLKMNLSTNVVSIPFCILGLGCLCLYVYFAYLALVTRRKCCIQSVLGDILIVVQVVFGVFFEIVYILAFYGGV
jgi:hypothetical protein